MTEPTLGEMYVLVRETRDDIATSREPAECRCTPASVCRSCANAQDATGYDPDNDCPGCEFCAEATT